jgi:hypothetical protein
MGEPKMSIGKGRSQIVLQGKDAIEAGGWSIKFLFVAFGVAIMTAPALGILLLARWWYG